MQRPAMPPRMERKGPTLNTLHMVESVVRKSDEPLSLNRIKGLLPRKVMHATLREAIEHYKRLGCVSEGSKGVLWTLNVEPGVWDLRRELADALQAFDRALQGRDFSEEQAVRIVRRVRRRRGSHPA